MIEYTIERLGRLRQWALGPKYDRFTRAEVFREQGAQIGENCSIIPTTLGPEPYLVKIGNHVTIAGGVRFMTCDGGPWKFAGQAGDAQLFGPIVIEDNCAVGKNAILCPNVRIGRNSIVGAGSMVVSDVPPDSIVMGVPARVLGAVAKYREKCVKRWAEQRPPDYRIEEGENWWNSRHFSDNREKLKRHLLKLFEKELGS